MANGRVYRHSLPYVPGESVHWVTMTYDALGRTLTEDEVTGTSATYLWGANCYSRREWQREEPATIAPPPKGPERLRRAR